MAKVEYSHSLAEPTPTLPPLDASDRSDADDARRYRALIDSALRSARCERLMDYEDLFRWQSVITLAAKAYSNALGIQRTVARQKEIVKYFDDYCDGLKPVKHEPTSPGDNTP